MNWNSIVLKPQPPATTWQEIFGALLNVAAKSTSPVALHDATVEPDRLLAEAAWELWHEFPGHAPRASTELIRWCAPNGASSLPKAVLILDALSLRELPLLLGAAADRHIQPLRVALAGSECPSTTDEFARAIGLPSRSALANNHKPAAFALFNGADCYTDVLSTPFEDCTIPNTPNLVFWHSWLDDLIHLQHKLPDQISAIAASVLKSDGFWQFINRLRQGRRLVITADHGYASSKRFSSEVEDPVAIDILRSTFGASRCTPATEPWRNVFMPPTVITHNNHHVVVGQRKWKVQGGFPHICHGGMSLLETVVPWIELEAL
jgi:hypothetical protein